MKLLLILKSNHKTVVFITHSISEAIFISDRVIVISKRPGRIIEDITIALPRPRLIELQETIEFMQLRARVRKLIEH
jgi:NitT/TauT family transport system ATP-binding protein